MKLEDLYQLASELSDEEALEMCRQESWEAAEPERDEAAGYPLSEGQKALWVIYQLSRDNYAYNTPLVFRLRPEADLPALKRAVGLLVKRRTILSTRIAVTDGNPLQHTDAGLPIDMLEQDTARMTEEQLEVLMKEEARSPFELENGPLFKVRLYRRPDGAHLLFFNIHHIIFDGISSQILVEELEACYQAELSGGNGSPGSDELDYGDYVRWQRAFLAGREGEAQKQYWLGKLNGGQGHIELPYDKQRPASPGFSGKSQAYPLPGDTAERVRELAAQHGFTPFMVMLSAYTTLLYRYSQSEDIPVGTPMAGRPEAYFERVIGYFMNMVVIRSKLNEHSRFIDLLRNVKQAVFEALENSDYPYFTLLQDMRRQDKSVQSLFNTAFYYQNWLEQPGLNKASALIAGPYEGLRQEGEFDLTLEIMDLGDGYRLYWKYNPDLFEDRTIERMNGHYVNVLSACVADTELCLSEIGIMEPMEATGMLDKLNHTECTYPIDKSAACLFAEQAEAAPAATAVISGGQALTYGELDRRSDVLASYLQSRGIGRGRLVGVFMERSVNLLTALIGVLKSGAGFVPLDPLYPPDRIRMMLEDSKTCCVISEAGLLSLLPEGAATGLAVDSEWSGIEAAAGSYGKPSREHDPKDAAYVIFTSGSTGRPKGVEVAHQGLTNFLCSMAEAPGFGARDHLLAVTTVCFDIAYLELLLPLVCGGVVELVPSHVAKDGIALKDRIEEGGFTVMQATPATWSMLLKAGWSGSRPFKLLCGGEALSPGLADQLLERAGEVWNMYGPTETTIWSSVLKVSGGSPISLGHPIANTQMYVLDQRLQPCPPGVAGELHIGGYGLANGYWNNRKDTDAKFIVHSLDGGTGKRLYKTGDLACYRADGTIEYLGRMDNQVKIRGYRIELSEIETALKGIGGVQDAVVVLRNEGERRPLTAFLITGNAAEPEAALLKKRLAEVLPDYMIPAHYIAVETYPHTLNNKIDRKTLSTAPLADLRGIGTAAAAEQPGPTEPRGSEIAAEDMKGGLIRAIAGIMELDPDEIDTNVPIGNYGFDSISFTDLGVAVNRLFGIKINATLFYEYSTIDNIAAYLSEQVGIVPALRSEPVLEAAGQAPAEAEGDRRAAAPGEAGAVLSGNAGAAAEQDREDNRIAIVGMSARLPGSPTLQDFWNNLERCADLVTEIPEDRWDYHSFYGDSKRSSNKSHSKWGGFMSGVDHFDSLFFGISPREAEIMDPQQRLFLEVVWETFENAGYRLSELSGSDTGVFVGCTGTDFLDVLQSSGKAINAHSISGLSRTVIPNRVSYLFNFHGPSAVVDTACSSSLVAVHRAVAAILNGECSMAIAGGVNLILSPFAHIALSKTDMLSPDGRCRAFDQSANGYVRGEGIAAVLLKPLAQAVADGDHIHGVICASAENHGGRTNSLTSPNVNAQADLLVQAYRKAGIDSSTVTYLEAHGTGTALGDPIEINGIQKAFDTLGHWSGGSKDAEPYCAIGSVKANIGHLEATAGIAGLLKVLLAMKHRTIPGNPQLSEPNPLIELERSPFYLVRGTQAWKRLTGKDGRDIPFRAGVSSFGFGGVNAHIVIEEFMQPDSVVSDDTGGEFLIVLSAQTAEALREYAERLLNFLENAQAVSSIPLSKLAFTLQTGREEFEERLALSVHSLDELQEMLISFIDGHAPAGNLFRGSAGGDGQSVHQLLEGSEGADYVRMLIKNKRYRKLASLWADGARIDWKLLYGTKPGKLPLPVYPFARTAFKLPVDFNELLKPAARKAPLIDRVYPAPGDAAVCFHKTFNGREPILKDHEVNGMEIMPGVGYLEMVHQAASMFRSGPFVLSKLAWLQPLTVAEEQLDVYVLLKERGEQQFGYEVRSGGTEGMLHAQGTIGKASEVQESRQVSIPDIQARCRTVHEREPFYRLIRDAGIHYRTYFQSVQRIWSNGEEALGAMQLPADYAHELEEYNLHPSLADGALQTMAILMNKGGAPRIPFAAERVEFFRPLTAECYAYVQRNGEHSFHLAILDDKGNVCVAFTELMSRGVKQPASGMYYSTQWKQAGSADSSAALTGHEQVLVIAPQLPVELAPEFRQRFPNAKMLRMGRRTFCVHEHEYEMDTADPQAFEPLLEAIGPVDQVYFLGGLHACVYGPADLNRIRELEEQGVIALFRLIQALGKRERTRQPLRLLIVTNQAALVTGTETANPGAASLIGFAMGAAAEYPAWRIRHLDISLQEADPADLTAKLIAYNTQDVSEGEGLTALRGDRLYRQAVYGLELPPAAHSAFKQQGVYFIVGGAGGIGRSLSEYLAAQYRARLVWVGRRTLDEEIGHAIRSIEAKGGEAVYLQADASDAAQLGLAAAQAVERFGTIDGVIHSALTLRDQTIESMSESVLREVLAPKVAGTAALYHVFKEAPLDFMLFFSSTSSFLRSAGQSNYAAGSRFQDLFAQAVSSAARFPVKLINWSYWSETGIVAGKNYVERLNSLGMTGIHTGEGMETIERVLASPVEQVIVIKASPRILEVLGYDPELKLIAHRPSSPAASLALPPAPEPTGTAEVDRLIAGFRNVEAYGMHRLAGVIRRMGGSQHSGESHSISGLRERLGIIPAYDRLFDAIVRMLAGRGYMLLAGNSAAMLPRLDQPETAQPSQQDMLEAYPLLSPYVALLDTCLEAYPEVLTGKLDHMQVLFPDGSKSRVEPIYKGNALVDYYNKTVASLIRRIVEARLKANPGEVVKVLEIGAGTGGTSVFVFDALKDLREQIEYYYTDISPGFTRYGEKQYGETSGFGLFRTLDIEKDIEAQGFEPDSMDICFASNAIHATGDIQRALGHVKRLLRTGGQLILNELTSLQVFSTLTFGLTTGWWLFEDPEKRIPGSPLLSPRQWKEVLGLCGFRHTRLVDLLQREGEDRSQSIIVAESDGVARLPQPTQLHPATEPVPPKAALPAAAEVRPEPAVVQGSPAPAAEQNVLEELREMFAAVLKIAPSALKPDVPFEKYGVDSLIIIELNKLFEEKFGQVSGTVLFENTTLRMLAAYFMEHHQEQVERSFTKEPAEAAAPVVHENDLPDRFTKEPPTAAVQEPIHTTWRGSLREQPADIPATGSHAPAAAGTGEIAVIGLAGRYPHADSLDQFWDNLAAGKNCVAEIPPDRWDWSAHYDPSGSSADKSYSKWGAFIADPDKFDAEFFEFNAGYAAEMDPQERIMLELTWHLLEDAGYPYRSLSEQGLKTGVFLGVMYGTYGMMGALASAEGANSHAQSSYWLIANRISHYFDFKGPSFAVDSACSSSLTALHLACESIRRGECNTAVVGGINLILHPRHLQRLSNLHNLSSDDKTRTFSGEADGFVVGEGAGSVLLKPLELAVRDGDRIYGVIKGTAVNSTGNAGAFMSPNPAVQGALIAEALERAQVDPRTISCLEAHGTGTALGDAVEISGLTKGFLPGGADRQYCAIGSVKSNIGHLEAAAGVSALTKVLLQLKHRQLVPTLHAENPNSYLKLERTPFRLQLVLEEWKAPVIAGTVLPRRAGVSSFGAGGANAHVIVEEHTAAERPGYGEQPHLIVLSAKKDARLHAYAANLYAYLQEHSEHSLGEIAYTLQKSRYHMDRRLAFIAESRENLLHMLRQASTGDYTGMLCGGAEPDFETDDEAVSAAIQERNLPQLARLWLAGSRIDWPALYAHGTPALATLPGYPFERVRHWLKSGKNGDGLLLPPVERPAGERSGTGVYTRTFRYNEPYLRDHVTFGKQVMLGVTHCSLALEAARKAYPDRPQAHIRNLLLIEPVIVERDEWVEVGIQMDGAAFASVYSGGVHSGPRKAARGEYYFSYEAEPPPLDVEDFIRRSDRTYTAGDIYTRKKPGVYGPALQTVAEAYVCGGEAVGKLRLTDEMLRDGQRYFVHPAYLDGAMVTRFALLEDSGEPEPFIPLMVKRITVFRPPSGICYSRVQPVKSNEEMWEVDLTLYDETGAPLVRLEGFVAKRVRTDEDDRRRKDPVFAAVSAGEPEEAAETGGPIPAVRSYIAGKLAGILQVPAWSLKPEKNFMDMGATSMVLVNLSQTIASDLDVELYPTLFFEYPTIGALSEYLANEYTQQCTAYLAGAELLSPAGAIAAASEKEPGGRAAAHMREAQAKAGIVLEERKEADDPLADTGAAENGAVAIIGISAMLPGSADLEDFWSKLEAGENLVSEIPADRWDWRRYYKNNPDEPGTTNIIWGGFMKHMDTFDPGFFGISPREANLMDPQQRLSLQLVWSAIEDAGYNPRQLAGSNTGVFIGVAGHDYADVLAKGVVESEAQALTGNAHNVLTGRISFLLDLHGPSEPIDTACSSSLVAVHRAVECLGNGECDLALAGGINVIASPSLYVSFDSVGILSPDGKCRTFDKDASGTVRGEGAGILLLKPLNQAVRDGDHIYGVVRGTAVNHGGKAGSLTAPNPKAQANVVAAAYEKAAIDPGTVGYIEAHGTGTALGDPVEINGLKAAFKQLYGKWSRTYNGPHIGIGTLKTNAGHLETAAGVAGILKIVGAMKRGVLPGLLHFDEINPYIQLTGSPFYLVKETQPWSRIKDNTGRELPYRAGISSFGFSGVNAHVVLEEYTGACLPEPDREDVLITLSARNEERLREYAESLSRFLKQSGTGESGHAAARLQAILTGEVQQLVAEIAGISGEDLDGETQLMECGLDTILLARLGEAVEERFGPGMESMEWRPECRIKELVRILAATASVKRRFGRHRGAAAGVSLRQIAYTLQTGREAMEARLAFIAEDLEDLQAKLEAYLDGAAAGDSGISSSQGRGAHRSEDDLEAEVAQLKLPEELERLAALWAQGADFSEWNRLYPSGLPGRVQLPAYPFSRQRYWVEPLAEVSAGSGEPPAVVPQAALTALIDSNESNLVRQCYKKLLRAEAFYLQDHIVDGRMILPGVVHLEMARMAGELAHPYQHVTGLANVTLIQPLQLTGEPVEAWTSIHQSAAGYDFRISLEDGTVSSQGEIHYGALPDVPSERLDLQGIARRCRTEMEQNEFYHLFEGAGFAYGTTFKPLRRISFYGDEALASIHLPDRLQQDFHSFLLHPVLMEGALQTAGFLANRHAQKESPYIPFAIGSLEIYGELPEHCLVYASFSSSACEEEVLRLDVSLIDSEGNVRVKIKDYSVRPLIRRGNGQSLLYRPAWEEKHREQDDVPVEGPIVLFHDDSSLCGTLSAATGQRVILVKPGDRFRRMGNDSYRINPLYEEEYRQLFEELEEVAPGYSHIVHMWSLEARGESISPTDQLDRGLLSLFYVSRAAVAADSDREVRMVHLYRRDEPAGAAVGGFYKSLYLENRHWLGRSVGMDPDAPELLPEILLRELTSGGPEREVRYLGVVRQVRKLEIYEPSHVNTTPLRENGVYLITGGAGGIGFQVALHLAKSYHARLVLNGRTAMNEGIAAKLAELERAGGQAVYVSGDISEQADVGFVLRQAKAQFGRINGILHCAGIIRDSIALRKQREDIMDVLEPKISGAVYLDEALRDEPLDLFVLFSSISGEIGNVGQCDYAYANSFLDHFARKREALRMEHKRYGKTVSINWPLWEDGGIPVDEATRRFMKQTLGLLPLSHEQGIRLFEECLGSDEEQLMVLYGNRDRMKAVLIGS
ncbi:non-ribosomal peptide synthetase [Paenibacillus sp. P32E]|uniref:non-ribosomal peptide synthetase n=1 Tax=Paenibacillus sp. P32E TaxID=1349434 RepID=UPI00093DFE28|nr:non-ribosomal peptide synthetase [Paenibacillus sp. P32E]OKP94478.1 hypothetical protein A3848_00360 [Paenibacillus sp. P32E]